MSENVPPSSGDGDEEINVRVALRVRPMVPRERLEGCSEVITFPQRNQLVIGADRGFTFDAVFPGACAQSEVYDDSVRPLVQAFLDGYNATVFAYGQTGSGKTYTMGTGSQVGVDEEQLGILPRVVRHMHRAVLERPNWTLQFRITFLEIHNEDVIDLLADAGANGDRPLVSIRERDGQIVTEGAAERTVSGPLEILGLLEQGSRGRATGATLMNEMSSRSHAIFTVMLDQVRDDEEQLSSKFHFVDLAGSERLKRTGAVGQRMKEGISINSGLLALGNVISALADPVQRARHVPFRDSKITRLLQDSLGGNSRTLMIACVSPADINFEETLNTLKYANRAKNIKNKAVVNRDPNSAKLEKMRLRILELEAALGLDAGGKIPEDVAAAMASAKAAALATAAAAAAIGVGVGVGAGGGGGGAHGVGGSGIATAHRDLFEPSTEELEFLREQNQAYEDEVRRLLDNLKNARKQMSSISDALIEVEGQRDQLRLRLRKVVDRIGPAAAEAAELTQEEVEAVGAELAQVRALRDEIQAQRLQLRQAEAERERMRRRLGKRGIRVQARLSGVFERGTGEEDEEEGDEEEEGGAGDGHDGGSSSGGGGGGGGGSAAPAPASSDELLLSAMDDAAADELRALSALAEVKDRQHQEHIEELEREHSRLDLDIGEKERLVKKLLETRASAAQMRQEYETRIAEMEAQIEAVRAQMERAASAEAPENKSKSPEQRKAVAAQYERQLESLRRELARVREAGPASTESQVQKLRGEIEQHKKDRVKLQRSIADASEKHRAFQRESATKMKTLEKRHREDRQLLREMEGRLSKQTAVMKRQLEERNALSRQIQKQKDVAAAARQQRVVSSAARRGSASAPAGAGAGPGAVPSRDENLVEQLKAGFDEEVALAVRRLDLERHLEQTLKRRQVSRTTLAQAEQEMERSSAPVPSSAASAEQSPVEFWRDTAEACREEIRMHDSRIVQLRVELAKAQAGDRSQMEADGDAADIGAGGRSVFTRHRLARMDHARQLILHLMRQLVQETHSLSLVEGELEELKLNYEAAHRDLVAVSRDTLAQQPNASAQRLLSEFDQVESIMRKRAEEQAQLPPDEARTLLQSLGGADGSGASPAGAAVDDTPEKAARRVMRNNFMREATRLSMSLVERGSPAKNPAGSGIDEGSPRSMSPRSPRPQSASTSSGATVWDRLYSGGGGGGVGVGGVGADKLHVPASQAAAAGGGGSSGDVSPDERSPGGTLHRRSHSAFTDSRQRLADRRQVSASLESAGGSAADVSGSVASSASGRPAPGSGPSTPASSAAASSAAASAAAPAPPAAPAGPPTKQSVFDRLTDAERYTGVYKKTRRTRAAPEPMAMSLPLSERPPPRAEPPVRPSGGAGDGGPGSSSASAASGGGSKSSSNVFSRLADASTYTGVAKAMRASREKDRERAQKMAVMERDLESMKDAWTSSGGKSDTPSSSAAAAAAAAAKQERKKKERAKAREEALAAGKPDPFEGVDDDAGEYPAGASAFTPFPLMDDDEAAAQEFPHRRRAAAGASEDDDGEVRDGEADLGSEPDDDGEHDDEEPREAVRTSPLRREAAQSAVRALDSVFGSRQRLALDRRLGADGDDDDDGRRSAAGSSAATNPEEVRAAVAVALGGKSAKSSK